MKGLGFALFSGALLLLSGCGAGSDNNYTPQFGQPPADAQPEYVFAVLPVHNPKRLFEVYAPLIEHLNSKISNARLRLQASRSFADFERNIDERRFDFALPNPYETVKSLKHGYRVFGKMGDDDTFRGVILVRRDSHIQQVSDLRGKAVSFPAPTALAAALMPQYQLHQQGLDINRDIRLLYSGSHESSIMNVYLGNAAAGAVWLPPWQAFAKSRPDIAAQLEVRWQTGTLPNNGLIVRDDVPAHITEQVQAALFTLHRSPEGRSILAGIGISRFESANDRSYEPVREFLHRFSQEVRPIDTGDIP